MERREFLRSEKGGGGGGPHQPGFRVALSERVLGGFPLGAAAAEVRADATTQYHIAGYVDRHAP